MLLDKPSLSTAVKELFASIVTFPSRTVSARFEETSNVSTLRRCSTFTSQVKKKNSKEQINSKLKEKNRMITY